MSISKHSVVTIHYTLKTDEGDVIDSSAGAEPLVYLHGIGELVPGLEDALNGSGKGEKVKVHIKAEDGYGERRDDLLQEVPKSEFEDPDKIQVNMQFEVDTDQGPMILSVREIKEDTIIVDGNHPLAGVNLNFEVDVVDIRDATEEEINGGDKEGE